MRTGKLTVFSAAAALALGAATMTGCTQFDTNGREVSTDKYDEAGPASGKIGSTDSTRDARDNAEVDRVPDYDSNLGPNNNIDKDKDLNRDSGISK